MLVVCGGGTPGHSSHAGDPSTARSPGPRLTALLAQSLTARDMGTTSSSGGRSYLHASKCFGFITHQAFPPFSSSQPWADEWNI